MSILKRLNWLNTLFILLTFILGVSGTILLCVFGIVHWPTWIFAGAYTFWTGLCTTAGYHRLFAHKSYKASWLVRFLLLLFASTTFEGSALEWSTDHRNHHLYTDTDKDPYNIKKGFWWAHIGWLFMLQPKKRDFSNVKDLSADSLIWWQHRYFPWIGAVMGFVFPTVVAALWGDPLGGLLIAGVLRVVVNHQLTFCINSVCHLFGRQSYSRLSARDNWVTAIFTYGEGFHNFHHQFPLDYRNGVRAFHFDPTKWLIYALFRLGLVRDLRRIGEDRIIRYRLRMDEQSASAAKHVVLPLREKIHHILNKIEALEKACSNASHRKNREYRRLLKSARHELKTYLGLWARVIRQQRRLGLVAQM